MPPEPVLRTLSLARSRYILRAHPDYPGEKFVISVGGQTMPMPHLEEVEGILRERDESREFHKLVVEPVPGAEARRLKPHFNKNWSASTHKRRFP